MGCLTDFKSQMEAMKTRVLKQVTGQKRGFSFSFKVLVFVLVLTFSF